MERKENGIEITIEDGTLADVSNETMALARRIDEYLCASEEKLSRGCRVWILVNRSNPYAKGRKRPYETLSVDCRGNDGFASHVAWLLQKDGIANYETIDDGYIYFDY